MTRIATLVLAAFAAVAFNAHAASHAGGAPMKSASAADKKASAPMKAASGAPKKEAAKKEEKKK